MDGTGYPRSRRWPPGAGRGWLLLLAFLLSATAARGQRVDGFIEFLGVTSEQRLEEAGEEPREQSVDSLRQRYSLTYDGRLYPNVRLLLGGFFERIDLEQVSDLTTVDSTFTRRRPFVDLSLRTPAFFAQLNFIRADERQEQDPAPGLRTIREQLSTVAAWTPGDLPLVRLQYFHNTTRDEDRQFLDSADDLLQLQSEYRVREKLTLFYRGSLQRLENRIDQVETEQLSNNVRVGWTNQYWNGRFNVNTDYNGSWRRIETLASGQAEVESPVFPLAGLSSLDDTPLNDPLLPNPALVDGNRQASAGINLGLPPPGGDRRLRNMGLDFVDPTEINQLRVWVDRELDDPIARSFTWEIYTSEDNDRWSLRQIVTPAPYNALEGRFEIRFDNLEARFVKVAVAPLSPSVPFAQNWPEIFVTELEALLLRPAEEAETSTRRDTHLLTVNTRTRLLPHHQLFYELSYFGRRSTGVATSWILSNGVSLSQPLSRIYTVRARVTREDGEERGVDRLAYFYTASLNAVPVRTFRYNLVFSGTDEKIGDYEDDRSSVHLYTTTELYQGIDLTIGVGRTWQSESSGLETVSDQINAVGTFVPHRKLTLNLTWQDRTNRRESSGERLADDFNRAQEVSLAYNPLLTVYLFGSYRVEEFTLIPRRIIRNFEVSWAPFPGGTLRAYIRYNEVHRSDLDQVERNFFPSLRWDITNRWWIELAYQKRETVSALRKLDNEILSATMRIAF